LFDDAISRAYYAMFYAAKAAKPALLGGTPVRTGRLGKLRKLLRLCVRPLRGYRARIAGNDLVARELANPEVRL
jgi:hypothetical protein